MEIELKRQRKEKEKRQILVRRENFAKMKRDAVDEVKRMKGEFKSNL